MSVSAVSYTHLDVYKRQGAAYLYREKDFETVTRTLFKVVLTDTLITEVLCQGN